MAKRSLVFASLLMVVGIVMLANISSISAQIDCGGDLQYIFITCMLSLVDEGPQTPPTQACCSALKTIDVPCFYKKYANPITASLISMGKAIDVARKCGHSVPAGLKCGNYTVPPVSAQMPKE